MIEVSKGCRVSAYAFFQSYMRAVHECLILWQCTLVDPISLHIIILLLAGLVGSFHVLVAFSLHLQRKSMIPQALPGSGKVAEQTPACLDRFLMPAFVASSVVK